MRLTPWWIDLPVTEAPAWAARQAHDDLLVAHTTLKRRYDLLEHAIFNWNSPARVDILRTLHGPPPAGDR